MSIISRIQELIASDDCDQSERLEREYTEATKEEKDAIDNAFICVCGYSLASVIKQEAEHAMRDHVTRILA